MGRRAEQKVSRNPAPRSAGPWHWRAISAGVVASLIAALIAAAWAAARSRDDVIEATFLSPSRGAQVGQEVRAEGQLSTPVDQPLWLVTRDPQGQFHPANDPCLAKQRRFDCGTAFIGTKAAPPRPESWRVLLVSADPVGHEALLDFGEQQKERPSYEGFGSLFPGLEVVGDVGVTRVPADAASSRLTRGEVLPTGFSLLSPNGRYSLDMQADGNLVLRDLQEGDLHWESRTRGTEARAILRTDGNFLVETLSDDLLWATGTDMTSGRAVVVQDDGRAVLEAGQTSPPLWVTDGVAPVIEASDPRAPNALSQWEALRRGRSLTSPDGTARLLMQEDGDLVLTRGGVVVWRTDTAGHPGAALAMQHDGNLVLYADPEDGVLGRAIWTAETDGSGADILRLEADGLRLFNGMQFVCDVTRSCSQD